MSIEFEISFDGSLASANMLSAYDAAVALAGFERTLALTTHAVLNGKIIVQAPALKGADIVFYPPEPGSWKTKAAIIVGGLWAANSVDSHSPIGHLLFSAYDYVLHQSIGVDLDYDTPLRVLIDETKEVAPEEVSGKLSVEMLDAVIERCENSVVQMHRPIIESKTATSAVITPKSPRISRDITLDSDTFEYVARSIERKEPERFVGAVSSYNMNSFTGRVYIEELKRTVPFILGEKVRTQKHIRKILNSLQSNALGADNNMMTFEAMVLESTTGRIKRLIFTNF